MQSHSLNPLCFVSSNAYFLFLTPLLKFQPALQVPKIKFSKETL